MTDGGRYSRPRARRPWRCSAARRLRTTRRSSAGTPLTTRSGTSSGSSRTSRPRRTRSTPANTHVTSSDIAFWGDLAYVGDYGGFRIFDISEPDAEAGLGRALLRPAGRPVGLRPRRRRQGGHARAVGRQRARRPAVRRRAGRQERDHRALSGRRMGGHADLRHLQPARAEADRDRLPGLRLAHEHAAARARAASRCTCSTRATRSARARPAARSARSRAARSTTASSRSIEIPFDDPAAARELTELPVVYPGDADGIYRPVSEHGIAAPLDNFLGCHDLSSFPAKGIVGAACGEQAQVWNIDKRTGLPDTANPRWVYDQPNVDFWHSATFSWDGKVANFIDESFGDGCPTVTTKTGGLPGPPKVCETGNMFFFETEQRRPALGVPQPAADERRHEPDDAASTARRTSASRCRRVTATCSSTRTTAAARR